MLSITELFKMDFVAFKTEIISMGKRIVDTDVVNDAPKYYCTCGQTIFMARHYPLKTATSYDLISSEKDD